MAVNHGVGGFVSSASKVLGQDGFQAITSSASAEDITGTYCLYFYETSTITSLKALDRNGALVDNTGLNSETVPAGTYLFGTFLEITLSSGAVICYGIIP